MNIKGNLTIRVNWPMREIKNKKVVKKLFKINYVLVRIQEINLG